MSQAQEHQPRLTAVCSKLFWETGPGYIAREKAETLACVIFCQCVCTSVMADYLQQKTHQKKNLIMLTLLNCRNYLQKEGTSQFSYCTVEERGKGDLYQGVTKLAFPSVPIFSWHKEK